MKNNGILAYPGLRIASLVIAFLVWLAIMNVSDPIKIKTFNNIPVNVTNASYLEGQGMSYKLANGSQTISVTVNTNRALLEKLSASSITATADLTQIIDFDSDPVMVPVNVTVPGVASDSFTANPRNIEITLEDLISQEFVINASAGETTPANGHEIGSMSATPEKLTLRGPKTLVEKIEKVVAYADVSHLEDDAVLRATVRIYDRNGDILDDSQMKYLTPATAYDDIRVRVRLYDVLPGVPITAESFGTPMDGYSVGEITVTPATISLVGDENALAVFKENGGRIVIDSGSGAVDVSGASKDQDISVRLTDYIPSDMRLAADLSEMVVVNVKILEQNTESFEIETREIEQRNLPENMNAVFKESGLDVRIRADREMLEKLKADEIRAYVDFKEVRAPGDVTLPVQIVLPAGYTLAAEVTADITISEQEVTATGEPEEP